MLNEYELFYDMFILRNNVIHKENFKNKESRETFLIGLLKYMIKNDYTYDFFLIASYLNREKFYKLWKEVGNPEYLEKAINIEERQSNNCYFHWKWSNPLSMIIVLSKISGYDYSTFKISKKMKKRIYKCLDYNSNDIKDKYELFYNMYIIKDDSVLEYLENLKDKENDGTFLIGLLEYMIDSNITFGFFNILSYLNKEQCNKLWGDINFKYHIDYLIYAINDIKIVNKKIANMVVNLLKENGYYFFNLDGINAKIKKDIYKCLDSDFDFNNDINGKYELFYSRYKNDNVTVMGYLENFEEENKETFLIGLLEYMIENNETFGFFDIASSLDKEQLIILWEEVGSLGYLEKAVNDSKFINKNILSILINLLKISDFSNLKISEEMNEKIYECLNSEFNDGNSIYFISKIGIAYCLFLVPTKMADLKKTLYVTLVKRYPSYKEILQVYYEFLGEEKECTKEEALALDNEYFALIGNSISNDKEKVLGTRFVK